MLRDAAAHVDPFQRRETRLRDGERRVELAVAVERARVFELRHAPARGVLHPRDHARDRIVVVREHDQADRVSLDEAVQRDEYAHG